ncbi:MAG: amidase [Chloroflexota bacterium]|nr:amidase [Chloroflexota bacterium]
MTTAADLCMLSLEDIAAEIASKRISPVEVTEAVLARVEELNPKLNAYMTLTAEQAIASARIAENDIAAGTYRGALHGVPVGIKDLFATEGVRTTAGSKILSDWCPDHDATVVAKLNEAGAISVGKLGMHEWAFGATSDNVHYGTIRNPWDTDRVPGGSSGGSGVATAAGMAFATLGSDTGGSIRTPASLCGCVGMMPTYGRASLFGAVPVSWSLDHPGPLTRTVRDAAIVLQAISGHDPLDPSTERVPVPDWMKNIERGPKGLRIGVPRQYFWKDVDPEIEALVWTAINALSEAGAVVTEVDLPDVDAYAAAIGSVMLVEAAAYHADNLAARRQDYGTQVAALLDIGGRISATSYAMGLRLMQHARLGAADAWLEGIDVLAMPTTPVQTPTIEESKKQDPSAALARNTSVFDFTGQPAISVPCGHTSGNMPAGIMFAGRLWDEASVLWAGHAYEQVRGPFPAPPLS